VTSEAGASAGARIYVGVRGAIPRQSLAQVADISLKAFCILHRRKDHSFENSDSKQWQCLDHPHVRF
jgi:hypothetical protein